MVCRFAAAFENVWAFEMLVQLLSSPSALSSLLLGLRGDLEQSWALRGRETSHGWSLVQSHDGHLPH